MKLIWNFFLRFLSKLLSKNVIHFSCVTLKSMKFILNAKMPPVKKLARFGMKFR